MRSNGRAFHRRYLSAEAIETRSAPDSLVATLATFTFYLADPSPRCRSATDAKQRPGFPSPYQQDAINASTQRGGYKTKAPRRDGAP